MTEMPIEEAKKLGAMALFGEKYGAVVRVVRAGDFSVEFCGGTHIDNTARLGLFKITGESSVAAGVRRIEAVTGFGVKQLLDSSLAEISSAASALKTNGAELVQRAVQLTAELKAKEKELAAIRSQMASVKVSELVSAAQSIGSVRVLVGSVPGLSAGEARAMCDKARDLAEDIVAVIAGIGEDKAVIACAVGKKAQLSGAHAGNIVREIAKLAGGNGGGRPDSATAGAKDLSKVDSALSKAKEIVAGMLK